MIGRSLTGVIGLAVLLVISVGTVAHSSEVAKQIEAVEVKAWDLWKAKEKQGYAALFGEPAVRVTAEGVNAGVANTVALDTPDNCSKRHYELQKMTAHKITDDVFVLTYRAKFGESCDGKAATYSTYFSSTYRREGDDWKNVVYTETAVAE